MSKLSLEEKAKWVREMCQKLEMTAYEIGTATSLNVSGLQKFLRDTSVTPRNSTLNTIIDYIEQKAPGAKIPGHINYRPSLIKNLVKEPEPAPFQDLSIYKDYVDALKKNALLEGEIIRLKELLDAHGIKHEK